MKADGDNVKEKELGLKVLRVGTYVKYVLVYKAWETGNNALDD